MIYAQDTPQYINSCRLRALRCAREALAATNDWRIVSCVQTAERYLQGTATVDQLRDAGRYASDLCFIYSHPVCYAARAAAYAAAAVFTRDTASVAYYADRAATLLQLATNNTQQSSDGLFG